jgi:hypothetical protein
MWGVISSHSKVQSEKARELQRAEIWLASSVIYLVYLLFHIAFIVNLDNSFWIPLWQRVIHGSLGIPSWERCGGWACALILGSTLVLTAWRVRLI